MYENIRNRLNTPLYFIREMVENFGVFCYGLLFFVLSALGFIFCVATTPIMLIHAVITSSITSFRIASARKEFEKEKVKSEKL